MTDSGRGAMAHEPLPIHIDTDPGVDDLLALAVAFASPELRVVGLTTVAGNAPIEAVTENARRFLALAGERVPVGRGAPRPRRASPVTATHVHGEDGRQGVSLPEPEDPPPGEAQETLRRSIEERGARVVVALGPLTNVAEALDRIPDLGGAAILWMGGSLGEGNVTPRAEFNAYVDPDAADLVLSSAVPLRIVGLDVTRNVVLRSGDLEPDPFAPGPRGQALGELLHRLMEAESRVSGEPAAVLHDPCAVAALLAPERFRFEEHRLCVRGGGGPDRGHLRLSAAAQRPRVRYATSVQGDAVAGLCLDRMRRFTETSVTRGGSRPCAPCF